MPDFLSGKAEKAVTAAISLIVVLSILAAVMPDVFTAVGDINNVFDNNASDLNNSVAASIAPVFPILIGLSVLLGVVTFILSSTNFGRGGGGSRFG